MTLKIEKGIPAPIDTAGLAHEMKAMIVGDSFYVVDCSDHQRSAYMRAAGMLPGFFLVSAKATGETDEAKPTKGLRFWRVAARTMRAPRKYTPKAPDEPSSPPRAPGALGGA